MRMISGQIGVNTGDRTLTDGIYILLFTSFAVFIAVCADGGSCTIRVAIIGSPFSAFCGHLRTAADLDLYTTFASTNAASIFASAAGAAAESTTLRARAAAAARFIFFRNRILFYLLNDCRVSAALFYPPPPYIFVKSFS